MFNLYCPSRWPFALPTLPVPLYFKRPIWNLTGFALPSPICSVLTLILKLTELSSDVKSQFLLHLSATLRMLLVSSGSPPSRLQCRGDGGWPWQAAGVLRDLVRLFARSALTWPGKRRGQLQHRGRVGSSGSDEAQQRAGCSPAVCPGGDHSAGHTQHHFWEVLMHTWCNQGYQCKKI